MKNNYYLLVFLLFLLTGYQKSFAQCNSNTGYDMSAIMPTNNWQTVSGLWAGDFVTFAASADETYYFSLCSAYGGGDASYDSEITITSNTGTPVSGAYSDDDCGDDAYLEWTCPASGTYRVYITENYYDWLWGYYPCESNYTNTTLAYKKVTPPVGYACTDPIVVNSYIYTNVNTTCGAIDNYGDQCVTGYGAGSQDMVYQLTITTTGTYTINLTNTSGTGYIGWFLKSSADCANTGSCLTNVTSGSGNTANGTYNFSSAGTYYLIIETDPSPACADYTLVIYPPSACAAESSTGYILTNGNGSLPYSAAGQTTTGMVNDHQAGNTITCGSSSYLAGLDKIYKFIPSASGNITINLTNASQVNSGIMLYKGCPSTGAGGVCVDYAQSASGTTRTLCDPVTAGVPYYLIVDRATPGGAMNYDISISAPAAISDGATCSNALVIGSLPYSQTGQTTACFGNDYTNADPGSCGSNYESGEDKVYSYTATGAQCISVNVSGANSSAGFQVYDGCPSQNGTTCFGSYPAGSSYTYTASASGNDLANDCNNWVFSWGISFNLPDYVPAEATITNVAVNITSIGLYCGSGYTGVVILGNTAYTQCSGTTNYALLNGLPPKDQEILVVVCDLNGSSNFVNLGASITVTYTLPPAIVTLPGAGTYYIIVQSDASGAYNTPFDISVDNYGSGPANDAPCQAQQISLGVPVSGDNTCSTGLNEPENPTGWTNGNLNTVWYAVVAPASGQIKVRTALGTLTDTQIGLYSGSCGTSMTLVGSANDDWASCGWTTYYNSDLTATGLTPGETYYIRVDGYGNKTGTFSLLAIDGTSAFPSVIAQECDAATPACATLIEVGDPGYQGIGNYCAFGSDINCLSGGERGSAWYEIKIASAGNLMFTIKPNDYSGTVGSETDYDFALWKTGGAGAVSCANISSGSAPLRCNFSEYGVTGLYTGGNAPSPYSSSYNSAFETPVSVAANDIYLLLVSNFTNSHSGFSLNFANSTAGINTSGNTTVTWSGGAGNTNWFEPKNWGGCAIPSCSVDAVISPSSANQPVIDADNAACKSLIINPGSKLTINSGRNINICGDYNNRGTLSAQTNSTVTFIGTAAAQSLKGNLIGTSRFAKLTIEKTGSGTVTLFEGTSLEIAENFTTANANSLFNGNGNEIKVGGNVSFYASTFTPGTGGILEMNGTGTPTITTHANYLYNFISNKSSGTISLSDDLYLDNDIYLESGTLDVTTSNRVIRIYNGGSWVNGGGSFASQQGEVQFLGNAQQRVQSQGGAFYNIRINKTLGSSLILNDPLTLNNNLVMLGGVFDVSINSYPINIKGSWLVEGGTFYPRSGLVRFSGSATQLINKQFNTITVTNPVNLNFYDLLIDGNDVRLYYINSPSNPSHHKLNVLHDLKINTGKTLNCYGN